MALLLAALCASAHAQYWGEVSNYVTITDTSVERLSNAVRIVLKADGTLQTDVNSRDFWVYNRHTEQYEKLQSKRLTINLLNARSQVGRYVEVGMYPASHVTLSVPSEAQGGVGLEVTLNLFLPAPIGKIQDRNRIRDWTWDDAPISVDMVLSENERELIITVHSDEYLDVAQAGQEAPVSRAKRLVVEGADGELMLRAVNAPISEVADAIGQAGGLRIAVSAGLDRRLTANLPLQPVGELLATICRALCLQLSPRGEVLFISQGTAEDVAQYATAGARRVRLQSLSVDAALGMLPTFLLSYIRADGDSNALVITGPTYLLDKIEADLRAIDRPGKQVRIRALIVQMTDPTSSGRVLKALLDAGEGYAELTPLEGRLRVGVIDRPVEHVRAQLRALCSGTEARVEVQPDVTVTNGRPARLFVGNQQFYGYLAERWWGNELVMNRVDVGAAITASPWTGDGDHITVGFEIKADSIVSKDVQGIPLVARQTATGNLRIRSGDTLVFGGLHLSSQDEQKSVIRPLKDAFFPGDLCSDTAVSNDSLEVLVCLSVRAVESGEENLRPEPGDAHGSPLSSRWTVPSLEKGRTYAHLP